MEQSPSLLCLSQHALGMETIRLLCGTIPLLPGKLRSVRGVGMECPFLPRGARSVLRLS